MARAVNGLAVALRWFAGLWLVVWAIYATLIDGSYSSSMHRTMVGVAGLLIPFAVAFGVSCLLGRLANLSERPRQTPIHY